MQRRAHAVGRHERLAVPALRPVVRPALAVGAGDGAAPEVAAAVELGQAAALSVVVHLGSHGRAGAVHQRPQPARRDGRRGRGGGAHGDCDARLAQVEVATISASEAVQDLVAGTAGDAIAPPHPLHALVDELVLVRCNAVPRPDPHIHRIQAATRSRRL